MAEIGHNLGRALFGDPEMAAQQATLRAQAQQREAAAEADRAQARLYGTQADGVQGQNAARLGLPELFARMAAPERPAPPPTLDGFLSPEYQAQKDAAGNPDATFRAGLPALLAALAQSQGDKVSMPETIGSLASFLGGDEMARRGMVAQGHSPTKDFAITPGRADEIAALDAAAELRKALGVAETNHANDIPIANIQAGSAANVAAINNRDDIAVANINNRDNVRVAQIKGKDTSGNEKTVSAAAMKQLDAELDAQAATRGWDKDPAFAKARNMVRNRAVANLQRTGNPVDAAGAALSSIRIVPKGTQARAPVKNPTAYKDARQAPDGRWVVKRGNQWYEVQ